MILDDFIRQLQVLQAQGKGKLEVYLEPDTCGCLLNTPVRSARVGTVSVGPPEVVLLDHED